MLQGKQRKRFLLHFDTSEGSEQVNYVYIVGYIFASRGFPTCSEEKLQVTMKTNSSASLKPSCIVDCKQRSCNQSAFFNLLACIQASRLKERKVSGKIDSCK